MLVLRPYQEEIKAQVYKAWQEGHKNVVLVMPTGMGKTKTFSSIGIDLGVIAQNKIDIAVIAHRKELVSQASLVLAEEGISHNIIAQRETILQIVAAQRKLYRNSFYNFNSNIGVISVDTLLSRQHLFSKWCNRVKLWIVDEAAHLLKDNKWGKAVAFFPNALGLGVTATPQRLDKRGLGRHADGVFDTMVEGPTTRWGIEKGFLSKYKIAVPASDYQDYLEKASGNSDFSKKAMEAASKKSHIIGDVVDNYIKFANDKQAIVFATGVISAAEIRDKFLEKNISAIVLTGDTGEKERIEGMISFREKRTKVLVNVDLFDEGLDVPGIEAVIMARPTMSLAKYKQMVGRGLRPAKDKPHLIIIDHVGNVARHGLPCSYVKWTLDRIVKKQDKTNFIRICSNIECNAPFDRTLTECPWCGTEAVKASSGGASGSRPGPAQVDGDLQLLDPETLHEMEAAAHLESPDNIATRVGHVAGIPAGIRAGRKQEERIETQKKLTDIIAKWAGVRKHWNYTDRQIHKAFYITFGKTISQSLSEPNADMIDTIENINNDIPSKWREDASS